MGFLWSLLKALAVFYLVWLAALYLLQRHVIYPGRLIDPPEPPAANAIGAERIWLELDFGRVEAWLLAARNSQAKAPPAMIVAHGNGELIDFLPEQFLPFTSLGVAVLLVEYPGYGRSKGSPSQDSIAETFVAAYDWLAERGQFDARRIVGFGRSLGGGAIAALSRRRELAAMILQSSFTSTRPFARRYLAPGFLIRDAYDNLGALSEYTSPVLVIHGRADGIIPYSHGVALAQAAQNGELITYDCRHNDCPPDQVEFLSDVAQFLRRHRLTEAERARAGQAR